MGQLTLFFFGWTAAIDGWILLRSVLVNGWNVLLVPDALRLRTVILVCALGVACELAKTDWSRRVATVALAVLFFHTTVRFIWDYQIFTSIAQLKSVRLWEYLVPFYVITMAIVLLRRVGFAVKI